MPLADRLAELEALATKATPGPWTWTDDDGPCANGEPLINGGWDGELYAVRDADAAYIAACSPDMIRALCAELRAWRELSDALETPGGSDVAERAIRAQEEARRLRAANER